MSQATNVLVFNGSGRRRAFPSAVFTDLERAEEWIARHALSGTLVAHVLDVEYAETQLSSFVYLDGRQLKGGS